jgi:hypothetical protein
MFKKHTEPQHHINHSLDKHIQQNRAVNKIKYYADSESAIEKYQMPIAIRWEFYQQYQSASEIDLSPE